MGGGLVVPGCESRRRVGSLPGYDSQGQNYSPARYMIAPAAATSRGHFHSAFTSRRSVGSHLAMLRNPRPVLVAGEVLKEARRLGLHHLRDQVEHKP